MPIIEICWDSNNKFSMEFKMACNYERAVRILNKLKAYDVEGRFFMPSKKAYSMAAFECANLLKMENN